MATDTVQRLAQEVYEEMVDEGAGLDVLHEYVDGVVPAMTTTLFQLVVDDNSLAFLSFEGEADSPFAALSGALYEAVAGAVVERFEADAEPEYSCP